jgi:hypothetical protein
MILHAFDTRDQAIFEAVTGVDDDLIRGRRRIDHRQDPMRQNGRDQRQHADEAPDHAKPARRGNWRQCGSAHEITPQVAPRFNCGAN